MDTLQVIALADARLSTDLGVSQHSNAAACLRDAKQAWYTRNYKSARMWALKSLKYSVGILHPDYQAAAATETV